MCAGLCMELLPVSADDLCSLAQYKPQRTQRAPNSASASTAFRAYVSERKYAAARELAPERFMRAHKRTHIEHTKLERSMAGQWF